MEITENELQKNEVKIMTRNDTILRKIFHYYCVIQDNINYFHNDYNINDLNTWFHKE